MSILIKGMAMPKNEELIIICSDGTVEMTNNDGSWVCEQKAIELPPHGDLIDRNVLIKDGWWVLHKQVLRMDGYAFHDLPLKHPSIPVVIESEGKDG